MNKIIGLTGGIGSGKSTAAKFWPAPNIDADDIILDFFNDSKTQVYQNVLKTFGISILKNECIDRDLLRSVLSKKPELRKKADELVVPPVWSKVLEFAKQNQDAPYILFVSARLIEAQFPVDMKIFIDCPEETRIKQAIKRGTSEEVIRNIIKNQMPPQEKIKQVDHILINNQGIKELEDNIKQMHQVVLKELHKSYKKAFI